MLVFMRDRLARLLRRWQSGPSQEENWNQHCRRRERHTHEASATLREAADLIRELTQNLRPQVSGQAFAESARARRVETVQFKEEFTVSYSPDGRTFATAASNPTYFMNVAEGERSLLDCVSCTGFVRSGSSMHAFHGNARKAIRGSFP